MKTVINYVSIFSLLLLAAGFSSCTEDDEDDLPQVVAGFTQTVDVNTGIVTFINTSENATSYLWDFGDETTSTEINPAKTYANGDYVVTLTAKNLAGATATFTDEFTILIKEIIALPATFDDENTRYEAVTFNGASFEVVDNPDPSGSNSAASKVGAITNSGAAFEGIAFDLSAPIDLTTQKSITMNFWAEDSVDVLLKLEQGTAEPIETTASHLGTGWELIAFDFTSEASYSRLTLFVDGPGTTSGTFFIDDIVQELTICRETSLELPIDFDCESTDYLFTALNGASYQVITNPEVSGINNIESNVGEIVTSGNTAEGIMMTLDEAIDLSTVSAVALKVYSSDSITLTLTLTADAAMEETTVTHTGAGWELLVFNYITTEVFSDLTLTTDEAGTLYIDDIVQSDGTDVIAPIITLNGDATINLTVGDTFTDPGATATDETDGDITVNIVVGGDVVDANAAGTYVITYNVSDAAGNAATEVTRTVIVAEAEFDDGLLVNGDFEDGRDPWYGEALDVRTESGNSYFFANVETAGAAFNVNISQLVEITPSENYTLSFEASSDGERTMIAGIGESSGDFRSATQLVNLTSTPQTFELELTANNDSDGIAFGDATSRVLFDMGADVGVVVIDNVALFVNDEAGDTTPPVITLNGDATIDLSLGDTFTEPGYTATDDTDGDITDEVVVGGEMVDTDTEGTYTITYNVSDAAGNAAAEVTRTVIVTGAEFDDGLLENGDFEDGADPWLSGVGSDPAPVTTVDGNTYYSVNVTSPDAGRPFLVNLSQKLALTARESYVLTFDAWSDRSRTIIAGVGRSGGDFANAIETVNITDTRTTYTVTFTRIGFGEADNRVLFDSNGEAGVVNIDNVSLVTGDGGDDTTPPVITLNGDAVIDIIEGGSFIDPGATANDNIDGDISENIIVTGGDEVNNSMLGTYIIRYNVSDAAENAAVEVTRTVNVVAFDDGLLTNGSFQSGADPWLSGVGSDPAPVTAVDGNTYYSVNVTSPDAGRPFLVNLSQKLALTEGESYLLTFDAWSDRSRTIIAGVGRSGGDFANAIETVNITDTRTTYTVTFTRIGFGEADNRVLFDSNGEAGVVNIDNVSLVTGDGGGGGATCDPPVGDLVSNGDFETGDDCGWNLFQNNGTVIITDTEKSEGTYSAQLIAEPMETTASFPVLKQEGFAVDNIEPGDEVRVTFDIKAELAGIGGVVKAALFSEQTSGAVRHDITFPTFDNTWQNVSLDITTAGTLDTSRGLSLEIQADCGSTTGCKIEMYIDNVSVVILE